MGFWNRQQGQAYLSTEGLGKETELCDCSQCKDKETEMSSALPCLTVGCGTESREDSCSELNSSHCFLVTPWKIT